MAFLPLWQHHDEAHDPAMTFFFLLLALAAVLAYLTVRTVLRDGLGTTRPPVSHRDDPQFHAPGLG